MRHQTLLLSCAALLTETDFFQSKCKIFIDKSMTVFQLSLGTFLKQMSFYQLKYSIFSQQIYDFVVVDMEIEKWRSCDELFVSQVSRILLLHMTMCRRDQDVTACLCFLLVKCISGWCSELIIESFVVVMSFILNLLLQNGSSFESFVIFIDRDLLCTAIIITICNSVKRTNEP